MRRLLSLSLVAAAIALAGGVHPARAALFTLSDADPVTLCGAAIASAERAHGTPPGLLGAIGAVESGRRDPASGRTSPWPWTIDVDGEGHVYATEAQAIAAVRSYQAQGHRSIDIGCMQVNLQQHPDAFADLAAAFSPGSNADYAAQFLRRLHDAAGDWMVAAGQYHSLTPGVAAPYRARVMAMLQRGGNGPPPPMFAAASLAMPAAGPFASSPFGFSRGFSRGLIQPGSPIGGPRTGGGRSLAAYRALPVALAHRGAYTG